LPARVVEDDLGVLHYQTPILPYPFLTFTLPRLMHAVDLARWK